VPNPVGSLAPTDGRPVGGQDVRAGHVPLPSGEGLHVGHPLGYIATDVRPLLPDDRPQRVARVGLRRVRPARRAVRVQTGTHPRTRTEANIVNFRRQLGRLGLGHDARRSFATTDADFYKWTQWIFLQIYNAWFDTASGRRGHRRADRRVRLRARTRGRANWAALSAGSART
jgi:leucyl-tRNA synthetase